MAIGVTDLSRRTLGVFTTAPVILDALATFQITHLAICAVGVGLANLGATVTVRLRTAIGHDRTGDAATFGLADVGRVRTFTAHGHAFFPGDAAIGVAASGNLRHRTGFTARRGASALQHEAVGVAGVVVVVTDAVFVCVVTVAAAFVFPALTIRERRR